MLITSRALLIAHHPGTPSFHPHPSSNPQFVPGVKSLLGLAFLSNFVFFFLSLPLHSSVLFLGICFYSYDISSSRNWKCSFSRVRKISIFAAGGGGSKVMRKRYKSIEGSLCFPLKQCLCLEFQLLNYRSKTTDALYQRLKTYVASI